MRRFLITTSVAALLMCAMAACEDDDAQPTPPEVTKYCIDLFASPTFACCDKNDRADRAFAARAHYVSSGDCADQLSRAITQTNARRAFDATNASACLSHLASTTCGAAQTAATRAAEEAAGCGRVVAGRQDEGQSCDVSEDCKVGLLCPPIKETGTSVCTKPAATSETCNGLQASSVDHPACQPKLRCSLISESPVGCPSPPCREFRCVPLLDENETCSGNSASECGEGLACRDGTTCKKGPPSAAGGPCRLAEHCADGLFCDPATSQCSTRKAAGTECRTGVDLECKGQCKAASGALGTCAALCGSG